MIVEKKRQEGNNGSKRKMKHTFHDQQYSFTLLHDLFTSKMKMHYPHHASLLPIESSAAILSMLQG